MRVICIDASPIKGFTDESYEPLVEGKEYLVEAVFKGVISRIEYYGIAGYPWEYGVIGHHAKRFAPISDIDETTFERNYQTQTA